ncbi:hypothetical protein [uncultured Desulfosarcina sp.]|uniref:ABC transporter substrate-binding protein n=1 Tax=uncultured Desulfosarcina sp. TaxID=218289 RepID=UPI0029C732B4|nr:hypothetical protein [uncultured Desulfosarcina sp.]
MKSFNFVKSKIITVIFLVVLFSFNGCEKQKEVSNEQTNSVKTKLTTIKFGMLPYGDHTYAIIGAKKGWFKEVGIDLEYQSIKVEEIVPFLKNNTMDVISCPPGILFSAYDNAPNLISFVFGDLFQGYAILAQPDAGYFSYEEFITKGYTHEDAIRATINQMKGKIFAYPTETAIKPFIDLALNKGGLTYNDIITKVLDDPLTIVAMRNKDADFQVGGVPSRLTLQKDGFKPIITSSDFAKGAIPSANSSELSSILQNGWATNLNFYSENQDTILRLASVNYRIMQYINDFPSEAIELHMPYLSQVSGQSFDSKDGIIIYNSLDPFFTFDAQKDWFLNVESPFYYKYINGSILNSFIANGIYKSNPPNVDDVIYADDVYLKLNSLKNSTLKLFSAIDRNLGEKNNEVIRSKLNIAKRNFEIFNFFDSERIAKEIAEEMNILPLK